MRKAILHLKRADPLLKALVERIGPYAQQMAPADFPALARSIVYQQLNGKAASTIYGRLEAAVRGRVTPRTVLKLTEDRMRELGLSKQKTSYIRDLAQTTISREVDFRTLPAMPDEVVIASLTAVRGIGVWTAQMFLIFALGRPDVLPTADLGIRAAMKNLYGLAELPKPAEMERIAAPWRPYCSVACWYLWRSLDNQGAL
ncbi:MAG: DNA-3-methyladenine glycosylase 2 family protein [Acidobacteria bacterium]|nr:DNA-3-methyladenine glycosylase 2 family protein [Acidobacteriota bacterium]